MTRNPVAMAVGARLRRARLRQGKSLRDFAKLLGVSWVTVREAELGRDMRYRTLVAYRRVVPELSAGALIHGRDGGETTAYAAWRFLAVAMGVHVQRMSHAVFLEAGGGRRVQTHLSRIQFDAASGETDLSSVLRLAWLSPLRQPPLKALSLRVGGGTLRLEAEGTAGFRVARDGVSLDHRFAPNDPASALGADGVPDPGCGASVIAYLPAKSMRLRVRFGPGLTLPEGARWHAWWHLDDPWGKEARDIGLALDEASVIVDRHRRMIEARCSNVLPGMRVGVSWVEVPTPTRVPPRRTLRSPSQLGSLLARERLRGGLSQRRLAMIMGTSPRTVAAVEAGREPARSTLAAWLGALPWVSTVEILPVDEPPCDRQSAWGTYREMLGIEVDALQHEVHISPEGDILMRVATLGLRCANAPGRPLVLRNVMQDHRGAHETFRVQGVSMGRGRAADAIRTRLVRKTSSGFVHEIHVPAARALAGISCRRRLFAAAAYPLTAERAREMHGPAVCREWGITVSPAWPARRLSLRVTFPEGFVPQEARLIANPFSTRVHAVTLDVGATLHPEGLRPRFMGRRLIADVAWPMPGVAYLLRWTVP